MLERVYCIDTAGHTGALGWNGFLTFSMLYWLFPRLYNTKLWSIKLANYHFWVGLLGMMFYVVPVYVSGVTQGRIGKQITEGTGRKALEMRDPNAFHLNSILPSLKIARAEMG